MQDDLARTEASIRTTLETGTVGAAFWQLCEAFGRLHGAHVVAHDGLVRLFELLRPYMHTWDGE